MISQREWTREQLREKEGKVKQVWIYINTYFNKMWTTFKNSDLKNCNSTISFNSLKHAENFRVYYIFNKNRKEYELKFSNRKDSNKMWYDLKFVIRWFWDFCLIVKVLYSVSFDIISDVYLNDETQQDYEILDYTSATISEWFDSQVKDSMQWLEKQMKFLNRSDKEILVNNKPKKKLSQVPKTQQWFTKTFDFETLKEQNIFSEKYPSHSWAMINQYLNEKVTLDPNNKIISSTISSKLNWKKWKRQAIKPLTYWITSQMETDKEKDVNDLYYDELSYRLTTEDESLYRSCNCWTERTSDKTKGISERREALKSWTLRSGDPEINNIYARWNDLRKWEWVFFKTKEKIPITNQEFHLIYQKWKYDYKKTQKLKENTRKSNSCNKRVNHSKGQKMRNSVQLHKMSLQAKMKYGLGNEGNKKVTSCFSNRNWQKILPGWSSIDSPMGRNSLRNTKRDSQNYSSGSSSVINKKPSQPIIKTSTNSFFSNGRNQKLSLK